MKKLIFLAALIWIAESAFSQSDYRKGYVITNDRDTLTGLVDYREGAKAYRSCNFQALGSQNSITYEPGSIVGYGFENDKFFLSKELVVKDEPARMVFFEVIVSGLVTLFKFEDTYFIEKDNAGHEQLLNETEETILNGKRVLRSKNRHISILSMLLFDCEGTRERVQKIQLTEKALTNLVEDYNRCKGVSSITYKNKKPWTSAMIGVTAGVNLSQLNYEPYSGTEHLTGDFDLSKALLIGISWDVLSPRLSERISLHGDLFYLVSRYHKHSVFDEGYFSDRNYVTIELKQVKIPIGIRYTFPERKFTPYLNAGISGTFHLSSSADWVHERESNNVVETYKYQATEIKKKQLGFWGGFGVVKSINNKLNAFVEFRYEQTDGISENTINYSLDLQSTIKNGQILIGLRTK